MREQRWSRRDVLRGLTAAAGGIAGCTARSAVGESESVSLLAAGSLQLAYSRGLADVVDVPITVETHGSTAVARLVDAGARDPDVVSLADTALFESMLRPSWYATFASNALVIAYDPQTAGGRRLADAGPDGWFAPILAGDVTLGRTDPALDPLGYRTLFMFELATRYYPDAPALRERLPERAPVYPETSLVSRLETGAVDAAVVYRNMAEERGYDYLDLPGQIDLSSPRYAEDWYASASYTLPGGTTVRGGLISYGSTVRHVRDPVLDVFEAGVTGEYLESHGFVVPPEFPTYVGDVPNALPG